MVTQRRPDDFYETPSWCVRRLLERVWLPNGSWLEPSAGKGALIKAVNEQRTSPPDWTACELNHGFKSDLLRYVEGPQLHMGVDYTDGDFGGCEFDCIIGNPPFSLAEEFVWQSLSKAAFVVMLLRLNFLESQERSALFATSMPDVYVLPNRPSFTGGGKTDRTAYAWYVWPPDRNRRHARLEILGETSIEERRRG